MRWISQQTLGLPKAQLWRKSKAAALWPEGQELAHGRCWGEGELRPGQMAQTRGALTAQSALISTVLVLKITTLLWSPC